ncbi:MAG: BON domain-containing protein [Fuerstia sp.]|nr:BON domain-containing protein [Fuerstiella sp.]
MRSEELAACEEADGELLQQLISILHQTGYELHRSLIVRVECGVVEVGGRVTSYHLRQIAVERIKRVAEVTRVVDQIVVDRTI